MKNIFLKKAWNETMILKERFCIKAIFLDNLICHAKKYTKIKGYVKLCIIVINIKFRFIQRKSK